MKRSEDLDPLVRHAKWIRALARDLGRLVELGPECTFEQDRKYALRLLVDIPIKALSSRIVDSPICPPDPGDPGP